MSGELRTGQFRYTITPDDDFVIGNPLNAGVKTSKYLVFQTNTTTGYGANPHLSCDYNTASGSWEINFSNDGASTTHFVYANYNNTISGTNNFTNQTTFAGNTDFTGYTTIHNGAALNGTIEFNGPSVSAIDIPVGTNTTQLATTQYVISELQAQKGAASGIAPLDANARIPSSYMPTSVVGALDYQGVWDATTDAIPTAAQANKGWYYKVSVAGNFLINGCSSWRVGDWIVSNGTTWDKVETIDQVTTVAGRQGNVVLTTSDVAEGDNEYFTQARTLQTILNNINFTAGTITSLDNVLSAFGKVQYQVNTIMSELGATGCGGTCTGACTAACTAICSSTCTGACTGTCTGTCSTGCTGSCTVACGGNCTSTCTGGCIGTCTGTCTGSCTVACGGSCTSGCTGSCTGTCTGGCTGSCTTSCGSNCTSTCTGGCTGSCVGTCTGACVSCTGSCSSTCTGGCVGSCSSCTGTCVGGCDSGCTGVCSGSCSGCTGCCFPAGTLVTMSDYTTKKIEDVKVGDTVICCNTDDGSLHTGLVKSLISPVRDNMCSVTFVDGTVLELTSDHPLFTKAGWWKSIDPVASETGAYQNLGCTKLEIGDAVQRLDGSFLEISDISIKMIDIQTYSLKEITPFANFFAEEFLCHNHTCFAPGTKVLMSDETTKNVEDIKSGDVIKTWNVDTRTYENGVVGKLATPDRDHINHIEFLDGRVIHCTSDHPLYTNTGWKALDPVLTKQYYAVEADTLNIGDLVLTQNGTYAEVVSVVYEAGLKRAFSPADVEPNHNFFADGILAHNCQ